jgi:hypothetical protein
MILAAEQEHTTEIRYDGILVGYRRYEGDTFVGYTWLDENYEHYEIFCAKRKLGG